MQDEPSNQQEKKIMTSDQKLPCYLTENDFPNVRVKVYHHHNTGHIYIRPVNNFKPFTEVEENTIKTTCEALGIGTIRNRVTNDWRTVPIKIGYGFRIF